MAALHEAAAARPAAAGHAIVLFLVWAATLGLAWNTWHGLNHPVPRWAEQVGPEPLWQADFPSLVISSPAQQRQ
jgi:hypothetical protein